MGKNQGSKEGVVRCCEISGAAIELTLRDYDQIGGLSGTLDAHGAEVLATRSGTWMAAFTRTVGRLARTLVMKEGESELLRKTSPSNKGGVDFPEGARRPVMAINDPYKLSRKDFEDCEFIVSELAKMAKMTFAEIQEHQKHHPEDNLCTLHHPKDNHLMPFTREGMKRFWQIARRGMKSLGPEGSKYSLKGVVSEIQKLFLTRLFDSPSSINDEQAHEIFLQVIAKISEKFTPSTHYVPCRLVAHTDPPQFRIGPVEFQLSEAFWKSHGHAVLESMGHESQHEQIKEFFTQQKWVASVHVGPCDAAVGADRATEADETDLLYQVEC